MTVHGGARPGAGRPRKPQQVQVTLRLPKYLLATLRAAAGGGTHGIGKVIEELFHLIPLEEQPILDRKHFRQILKEHQEQQRRRNAQLASRRKAHEKALATAAMIGL